MKHIPSQILFPENQLIAGGQQQKYTLKTRCERREG
jgi:hypothetical protein